MPAAVLHSVPARDVRPEQDVILGEKVTAKKVGTKWVHLTFGYGDSAKTHRYEIDRQMPVTRMEDTEEERAAKRVTGTLASLDYAEGFDRRNRNAAGEAVAADATIGQFPTWHALESLATNAEKVHLWDTVARSHAYAVQRAIEEAAAEGEGLDGGVRRAPSRLDVLAEIVESELDRHLMANRLSQSSSPASALQAQGEQAGRAGWLEVTRKSIAALRR